MLVAAEATAGEYVPEIDRIPDVVRGSGDAAVAAAEQRAEATARRNIDDDDDLPFPGDTANLRTGPELHPLCQPLLPLMGVWRGEGEWSYPTLEPPRRFGQRVTVSHDGRPFLRYEVRGLAAGRRDQRRGPGRARRAGRARGGLVAPAARRHASS